MYPATESERHLGVANTNCHRCLGACLGLHPKISLHTDWRPTVRCSVYEYRRTHVCMSPGAAANAHSCAHTSHPHKSAHHLFHVLPYVSTCSFGCGREGRACAHTLGHIAHKRTQQHTHLPICALRPVVMWNRAADMSAQQHAHVAAPRHADKSVCMCMCWCVSTCIWFACMCLCTLRASIRMLT
jgi:hypothetical protein